jgi:endonuclease/exonuclease/phosphatase family metal-dependent hydrolase
VLRRLAPAVLLVWVACARPPVRSPRQASTPSLKVMTYNVNYGIAGDAATIDVIRESGADVVFLQETNAAWAAELDATTAELYPHRFYRHWGGAGGLAVLSRLPVEDRGLLRPEGDGWFPAWLLRVTTAFGPVQVLSVHLRPPVSDGGSFVIGYFSSSGVHRQEMERFVARLDPALPTLVLGDFNEADGDAVRFLAARGLRSALPEFQPKAHTWQWPLGVLTLHDRLDHIVYDARLEPLAAQVLYRGHSDHFPVIATIVPSARAPEHAAAKR